MRHEELLTADEVTALLDQANTGCRSGLRNRVMLECMVHGGLRISEVAALEPGHVEFNREGRDLVGAELSVVGGKGGRNRVVPVDKPVAQWLDLWDRARPRNGRFFTTIQGGPVSTSYIRQMVYRYARRAGVQEEIGERADGKPKLKVHPHSLRHSYASALLDDDYTAAEVRDLLGHQNISTTNEYLSVNPVRLREKVQGKRTLEQRVADLHERVAELTALAEQPRTGGR